MLTVFGECIWRQSQQLSHSEFNICEQWFIYSRAL